ncbi:hypothetical protein V2550_07540 [Tenacibaculum maritimum]|uniref:hypothetical protein n=1 Tax=Tenacibaculum maritimum TaxID=107401 RepID=UPI003876D05A
MTVKHFENLMITKGIELKIDECDKYLSKWFVLDDRSSIKNIKKNSKYRLEEDVLNTAFELSNFLNESKLMKKIVLKRGFPVSLIDELEYNINALKVLLKYIKTKTNVKNKLSTYWGKCNQQAIKKYNLEVVTAFKLLEYDYTILKRF